MIDVKFALGDHLVGAHKAQKKASRRPNDAQDSPVLHNIKSIFLTVALFYSPPGPAFLSSLYFFLFPKIIRCRSRLNTSFILHYQAVYRDLVCTEARIDHTSLLNRA